MFDMSDLEKRNRFSKNLDAFQVVWAGRVPSGCFRECRLSANVMMILEMVFKVVVDVVD